MKFMFFDIALLITLGLVLSLAILYGMHKELERMEHDQIRIANQYKYEMSKVQAWPLDSGDY